MKHHALLVKSLALAMSGLLAGCQSFGDLGKAEAGALKHPAWSRNLSIYEVNVRQYTEAGTFAAFEKHLPRLRDMGVGILWFMPIQPIGEKNRKGTLGSYYSVKDYLAVNPDLGTMEEFKRLVREIHDMGMYVLIDWVANHTAWDNPLARQHPEWFTRNDSGEFAPPVPDWTDVIDLDYDRPGLWDYQIEALKFWVREADIDGFRCDVAGMLPLGVWKRARAELDKIKPVFMLAEWEGPDLHANGFDMSYDWALYSLMNDIAAGRQGVSALDSLLAAEAKNYPKTAYRMQFTSNHDENSWNGTVWERLDGGVETFAVLAATVPGMPLIYSGQEAGLNKRLSFFDKDLIDWKLSPLADLYTRLLRLKRGNRALWNGEYGGDLQRLSGNTGPVFAFFRESGKDVVLVALNFSDTSQAVALRNSRLPKGNYRDVFSGEEVAVNDTLTLQLHSWGYRVLSRKGGQH